MSLRCDLGELITAMVTPMDETRAVDYACVEKLAKHLIEQKNDAIVIAGTTGENPTLTHEEEQEVLYCVKSTVSGQCKVIMGAGSNSTQTAIASSKKAQELGKERQSLTAVVINNCLFSQRIFKYCSS